MVLPEGLGDLTGLIKLNLEMCIRLTVLPERLRDLTGLEELNLNKCEGLKVLPEWLPERIRNMTG